MTICICGDADCRVPFGSCHCGCGEKTKIARHPSKRTRRGDPYRYLYGHQPGKRSPIIREDAAPFKMAGVYCRLIPLSCGQYAIVDAEDYEWLTQLTWCASWNKRRRTYYAHSHIPDENGQPRTVLMHRMILGLPRGDKHKGDHIEGESGLDNRRKNLRIVTQPQNSANSRPRKSSATGLKGVTASNGRFIAQIRIGNKLKYLGSRKTPEEAHELYRAEALKEFGEFARFA
jgi:hypothetical protein